MKLTELNPRWLGFGDGVRHGLTFDCPHCRTQRLAVAFHRQGFQAIDDEVIRAASPKTDHVWGMTGETFDDLSLTPSVDVSGAGHWHGFVTNGEVS